MNNFKLDTIKLIDELKFKLKNRDKNDRMANALNNYLDHIINIFVLDQDPHAFATSPKDLPEKLKQPQDQEWGQAFMNFYNQVYKWIPDHQIKIYDFIQRCEHNTIYVCGCTRTLSGDVKSALLSLKEQGKINITDDGLIVKL